MSNEWYTPAKYVNAAREVMGGIDLDPASCESANETVRATKYYTEQENGLMQPWYGRVWLNPPYGKMHAPTNEGRSWIGAFTRHLLNEYHAKRIEQAILLATMQTDASWFHMLNEFPICIAKRVEFDCLSPNPHRYNGKASHRYGSIFVYLGPNANLFSDIFRSFGRIAPPDISELKPIARELWAESEVAV